MVRKPVRILPANFSLLHRLDIRDRKVLIPLNLWSVGILIASWFIFSKLMKLVHLQGMGESLFSASRLLDALAFVVVLLAITAATLLVHEVFHGIFFRFFTNEKPRYGFRGYYAFASAPEWYLPRSEYLVTALAPLVCVSTLAVAGLFVMSADWAKIWLWVFVFNASGSVGDLWVAWTLWHSPAGVLVRDVGDRVEIYQPS